MFILLLVNQPFLQQIFLRYLFQFVSFQLQIVVHLQAQPKLSRNIQFGL